MYFPCLNGKQEEVLAIRELASSLPGTVVPIFKPTDISPSTVQRYLDIAMSGGRFALIVNSDIGQPPPSPLVVMGAIDVSLGNYADSVFPAFELRSDVSLADLSFFSQRYTNRRCLIFHRNHTYAGGQVSQALAFAVPPIHAFLDGGAPSVLHTAFPSSPSVLIRDGFSRLGRNGDYPTVSNFDDLVFNYQCQGFAGFGDFSIVGDFYAIGGGAALHVTLHLTEILPQQSTVVTWHFVSRTPPVAANPQAKYFDALERLILHLSTHPSPCWGTAGIADYRVSHSEAHYPGLGQPKRWSIKHHTEMMAQFLQASGVIAAF